MPKYWGLGFASEASQKCKSVAFENKIADSIISIISLSNEASAKVALRNGMKIDKVTSYSGNLVNIFRVTKSEWNKN